MWELVVGAVVLVIVCGVGYFSWSRRKARFSIERGLDQFRRGLDALDPANDPLKSGRRGRGGKK